MDKEKAGGNREEKMCHYCVLRMLHNSAVFCFFFCLFLTQRGRIVREGITKGQQIAEGKK